MAAVKVAERRLSLHVLARKRAEPIKSRMPTRTATIDFCMMTTWNPAGLAVWPPE